MAKISDAEIAKMKEEMKELKAKVLAMKEKKRKNPNLFTHLEDMQLQNYVKMYNNMIARARTLKIPLHKPGE